VGSAAQAHNWDLLTVSPVLAYSVRCASPAGVASPPAATGCTHSERARCARARAQELNVTHIVNACRCENPFATWISYCSCDLADTATEDLVRTYSRICVVQGVPRVCLRTRRAVLMAALPLLVRDLIAFRLHATTCRGARARPLLPTLPHLHAVEGRRVE
jgi:hypothetical protein